MLFDQKKTQHWKSCILPSHFTFKNERKTRKLGFFKIKKESKK